ncbi:AraC family transcriptional regulator [Cohnella fermenti]|uniref:Helix-turn-helix domain-containing protein n=1 Tax=Cohnella fermenti TaxID=2565925 RepID=A0A4S4C4X5_9BACL|nr:AraC family transcriptional regulator [Cohnella fermenti]THF80751.1 helix-turn-helix domain-containing protein [Cohnella fermenti]
MKSITLLDLAPCVRLVQRIEGLDDYRLPPRIIYDYEMVYVLGGMCDYRIEQMDVRIEPGDLLIVPPRVRHSCSVPSGKSFHYYAVHFDLVYMGEPFDFSVEDVYLNQDYYGAAIIPDKPQLADRPMLRLEGVELQGVVHCSRPEAFEEAFAALFAAHERPVHGKELSLRAEMLRLFSLLLQETVTSAGVSRSHPQSERMHRAAEWIKEHYREPLQLADMAAAVHLSPGHFRALFKDSTGRSPIEYLMRHRIDQAKRLLLYSDRTVGEIADFVGYADIHYFSRIFKRIEGMSPLHYRESLGQFH